MVHNPGGMRNEKKNKGAKKGANEAMRQLITNFPGHIAAIQEFDKRILTAHDEQKFIIISPKDKAVGESYLAVMARKFSMTEITRSVFRK